MRSTPEQLAQRQSWMSLLAKTPVSRLAAQWRNFGLEPKHVMLRAPEIGGVMVRGRAGAVGSAFNLGEITVTRCSLRLNCGTVGHGYVQGRDRDHARRAALTDALMQTGAAASVEAAILAPLRGERKERKAVRAAKAAATKVEFLTLARGET
ncbi:MAG: phosphonate C-P lyase system protein PhnG [Sedimentitalea sp.]